MVAEVGAKLQIASTFGDGPVGASGRSAGCFAAGVAAEASRVWPGEPKGTADVAKLVASLVAASAVA